MRSRVLFGVPLLVFLAVGSFAVTRLALKTASPQAPQAVQAAGPLVPPQAALDDVRRQDAADRAKPRFSGAIGEFIVYNDPALQPPSYPCAVASVITRGLLASELNSSGTYEQGMCANGLVVVAFGELGARRYFVGKPQVLVDAPQDRLVLLEVDSRPALAVKPVPDFRPWLLYVIQRPATGSAPGIIVQVYEPRGGLQKALENAREIMSQ